MSKNNVIRVSAELNEMIVDFLAGCDAVAKKRGASRDKIFARRAADVVRAAFSQFDENWEWQKGKYYKNLDVDNTEATELVKAGFTAAVYGSKRIRS